MCNAITCNIPLSSLQHVLFQQSSDSLKQVVLPLAAAVSASKKSQERQVDDSSYSATSAEVQAAATGSRHPHANLSFAQFPDFVRFPHKVSLDTFIDQAIGLVCNEAARVDLVDLRNGCSVKLWGSKGPARAFEVTC